MGIASIDRLRQKEIDCKGGATQWQEQQPLNRQEQDVRSKMKSYFQKEADILEERISKVVPKQSRRRRTLPFIGTIPENAGWLLQDKCTSDGHTKSRRKRTLSDQYSFKINFTDCRKARDIYRLTQTSAGNSSGKVWHFFRHVYHRDQQ